jgi:hypothetical protein
MAFSNYRHPDETGMPDRADPILRRALEARKSLLVHRPDLRPLQEEIDGLLTGAGDAGNRMAVLEFLMEAHMMRLKRTLTALSDLLAETAAGEPGSPNLERRSGR